MVQQCLVAFELRVLERPVPTIDLTNLQVVMASLRSDVETILEMRGTKPEGVPIQLADDTLLNALFKIVVEHHP